MSKPPVAAYRTYHRYRVRVGEIESEVDRKKGKERNGEEKKVRW